ncbi:MAG: GlmU family protein [Flavobacteriales bacterium]|nr:GlmU family protein [Flavobacteriales bacterium]
MNIILFDGPFRTDLLPLTFTRPVCDLRIGILTIREKWEKRLGAATGTLTEAYLSEKFPINAGDDNLLIHGAVCPTDGLVEAILRLSTGQQLAQGELVIAMRGDQADVEITALQSNAIGFTGDVTVIQHPWDIFSKNGNELAADFELLTAGRKSVPLSATNTVLGSGSIFLEEGAKVEASILNTTSGPVYIGTDAEVMEGCIIRGPFALCEHGQVKMGAKIYGPTTVGPHSKVGGEVNNSVIIGYSNKGHDGFLGNSVVGEWCNLGADTNNSNLKNNYDEVRVWSYRTGRFERTGLQFCGLIMGDHSKSGINTMFNTGTVLGVSANVFGAGFPRTFIPSFTWGGASGFIEYRPDKALEAAARMMERRGLPLDKVEEGILRTVFDLTKGYRA